MSAQDAECVATLDGYLMLRRLGSNVTHLVDVPTSLLVPTKWIGPEYQALHSDAVTVCGTHLRPDHRGLVAMREGTTVCRRCRRIAHIDGHAFVPDDLPDQGHPSYTCAICGKRKAEHSDGQEGS